MDSRKCKATGTDARSGDSVGAFGHGSRWTLRVTDMAQDSRRGSKSSNVGVEQDLGRC